MPREVGHVALPVREDLRLCILAPDERVVCGNAAVIADAQHLADVVVELLREQRLAAAVLAVVLEVIVHREIDRAVGPEHRAARHRAARNPGVGDEQLLHVEQRIAVEPRARKRTREHAVRAFLHVVEVHEVVRRELRVHGDRPQRSGVDARRRPTRERRGCEHAAVHDPHVARFALDRLIAGRGITGRLRELRDQQIAVRRERDVARAPQAFRYGHEPHAEQLAGRALALRLAVRRARPRHPCVEHERVRRRRRWSGGRDAG